MHLVGIGRQPINFNVKNCSIQRNAQCQDHWIDHPNNFNMDEDIEVFKKVLFHNNKIVRHGQKHYLKCEVCWAEIGL